MSLPKVLPFIPVDDPVLKLPSPAEMEAALATRPDWFIEYMIDRQQQLANRAHDPLKYGHEPPIWGVVDDLLCMGVKVVLIDPHSGVPCEIMGGSEVYISGANRSSKTEYAASRLVRCLVKTQWARAWAFHTTGPSSTAMQQPRVWKYLPPEWRAMRKGKIGDIKYSPKNGFAGATPTFVGPNGAQCWFKNYAQSEDTIEGEELDFAWLDEMTPLPVLDAVRMRLATRKGSLVITFTPVKGYTATVRTLMDGAKDVLRIPATLLPLIGPDGLPTGKFEMVPRVQQASDPDLKLVYFNVWDNPWGTAEEVIKRASLKGREGILCRCYGVPVKSIGAQFAKFDYDVHVITDEFFRKYCAEGTNKMVCDPCSGRNFFNIWARALPDERTLIVYREWPSPGQYIRGVGDPGPWAEPDGNKADGKRGESQRPWGFGHERNIEEMLMCEGWTEAQIKAGLERSDCTPGRGLEWAGVEVITERDIDSRFGAAPTLARLETSTLIDSFQDCGMTFEPAPGEVQQEGIDEINNLLYFNEDQPIGPLNKPRLLIHERCKNLIYALQTWTGADGQHGACKDPIDVLRCLALRPPLHLPAGALSVRGGGSY